MIPNSIRTGCLKAPVHIHTFTWIATLLEKKNVFVKQFMSFTHQKRISSCPIMSISLTDLTHIYKANDGFSHIFIAPILFIYTQYNWLPSSYDKVLYTFLCTWSSDNIHTNNICVYRIHSIFRIGYEWSLFDLLNVIYLL
jgi:hypothetical protein